MPHIRKHLGHWTLEMGKKISALDIVLRSQAEMGWQLASRWLPPHLCRNCCILVALRALPTPPFLNHWRKTDIIKVQALKV